MTSWRLWRNVCLNLFKLKKFASGSTSCKKSGIRILIKTFRICHPGAPPPSRWALRIRYILNILYVYTYGELIGYLKARRPSRGGGGGTESAHLNFIGIFSHKSCRARVHSYYIHVKNILRFHHQPAQFFLKNRTEK